MNCRGLGAVAIAAGLIAVAGCADEDREELLDDATELAVRNFAAMQGAEQFNHEGFEIDEDGLSCTATVGEGGLNQFDVNCTGTTEDGDAAVLTGTTSEIPGASITELDGAFTATVDGESVFETDTLGG